MVNNIRRLIFDQLTLAIWLLGAVTRYSTLYSHRRNCYQKPVITHIYFEPALFLHFYFLFLKKCIRTSFLITRVVLILFFVKAATHLIQRETVFNSPSIDGACLLFSFSWASSASLAAMWVQQHRWCTRPAQDPRTIPSLKTCHSTNCVDLDQVPTRAPESPQPWPPHFALLTRSHRIGWRSSGSH